MDMICEVRSAILTLRISTSFAFLATCSSRSITVSRRPSPSVSTGDSAALCTLAWVLASSLSAVRAPTAAVNSSTLAADSSASCVLAATCCSKTFTDSSSSSLPSLSLVKVSTVAVSAVTFRTVSARSSAFSVLSRSRDVSLAANSEALAADSSASRVLAATCCSKAWTDSRSSSLVGREKSSA